MDPTNDTQIFKTLASLHAMGVSAFFDAAVEDNVYQENSLNYLFLAISGTLGTSVDDYDTAKTAAIAYLLNIAEGAVFPPVDRAEVCGLCYV